MNRLIKASKKVEVDPQAMEKLKVERDDFLHALDHDIKPVRITSLLFFRFPTFIKITSPMNEICF